jgi:hypothetical protein
MRLRTFCLTLACGLAGFQPMASFAQQAPAPQPAAQSPAQTTEIASLAALPAEIRAALGELSDRGGPFAAGCVSMHGEPHSRFKSARLGLDTAQVTVERGGIAHFDDTLEFKKVAGHWVAQRRARPVRAPAES